MSFVYRRKDGRFWWMCWTDANGVHRASSKTEDEAEAKALAAEIEGQAGGGRLRRATRDALRVERFYEETWLPLRQRTRPWAWKADRIAMERHFLPLFGLARLSRNSRRIRARSSCSTGSSAPGNTGPRRDGTVDAGARTRPQRGQCHPRILRGRCLNARSSGATRPWAGTPSWSPSPEIEDKERGWREHAGFSLEQVVALTHRRYRIPEGPPRPVRAALSWAAPRPGECCQRPAGANLDCNRGGRSGGSPSSSSFNSPMRREKSTKSGRGPSTSRFTPCCRLLLIDLWRRRGGLGFHGQAALSLSDLIVPRRGRPLQRPW